MKKENVIDLVSYRDQDLNKAESNKPISNDLEEAIAHLIYRLRELGPIQSSS